MIDKSIITWSECIYFDFLNLRGGIIVQVKNVECGVKQVEYKPGPTTCELCDLREVI